MKFSARGVFCVGMILAFAGCVTSHYKNDKGCDCTRRYFTPFGIPTHSCDETACLAPAPVKAQGEELKVTALAPSPSLKQSTPAETIKKNIQTTTQALNR